MLNSPSRVNYKSQKEAGEMAQQPSVFAALPEVWGSVFPHISVLTIACTIISRESNALFLGPMETYTSIHTGARARTHTHKTHTQAHRNIHTLKTIKMIVQYTKIYRLQNIICEHIH